jgi:hypothetical protein
LILDSPRSERGRIALSICKADFTFFLRAELCLSFIFLVVFVGCVCLQYSVSGSVCRLPPREREREREEEEEEEEIQIDDVTRSSLLPEEFLVWFLGSQQAHSNSRE